MKSETHELLRLVGNALAGRTVQMDVLHERKSRRSWLLGARGVIGVIALVITFTQLGVAQNTERLINLSHLLLITTLVRVMLTS